MNVANAEYRCAPWTLDQGIDPAGSAASFDRLLLVEVPLPWPSSIDELTWVASIPDTPGLRVQTIVPETARGDGTVLVTRWDRSRGRYVGVDLLVHAIHVPDALRALAVDGPVDEVWCAPCAAPGLQSAPPEMIVCGHGARDMCCGGSGTRLAVEIRAAVPEVRIRRTSHLGGHRFAPTALTLPDGRAWAFLDAETAVGILRRTTTPADARRHFRGSAALPALAQSVEAAAFVDHGWALFDAEEVTATTGDASARGTSVTLSWTTADVAASLTATVGIRRTYPVLQCGLDPSEATKTSHEYELLD